MRPAVLWLHGGGWKYGTHHTMPGFLWGSIAYSQIVALYQVDVYLVHFIPHSLRYSVLLFLNRQCD